MIDWGLIADASSFILVLLSFIYALKIHQMFSSPLIGLVCAMGFGVFLRGLHLFRNFGFNVPPPLFVSRLFVVFYSLLFLGMYGLYKPLRKIWVLDQEG